MNVWPEAMEDGEPVEAAVENGWRTWQLPDGAETRVTFVDARRAQIDVLAFGMYVLRDNGDGTHSHVPHEQWPSAAELGMKDNADDKPDWAEMTYSERWDKCGVPWVEED